MDDLLALGWAEFFAADYKPEPGLHVARVTGEERGLYRVQSGPQAWSWAEVTGRLRHDVRTRRDYPAVGDWVVCSGSAPGEPREAQSGEERLTIQRILARRTLLVRKAAGDSEDEQVLAANVDTAFLVTSLNLDLNPRRMERYLTLILDGGVAPVILMNKVDLTSEEDVRERSEEVRKFFPAVPVHPMSCLAGVGLEVLSSYLAPGKTVVLLGSSGVGKSTLINRMVGKELQATQEIIASDQRGRHTTTTRSLILLSSGAMLIDTPGMKELQMLDHEAGLNSLFDDVHALILACRFRNCAHSSEPGCAVKAARESGALPETRWSAYLTLEAEIAARERKAEKALSGRDRARGKKTEKQVRANIKQKRWDK